MTDSLEDILLESPILYFMPLCIVNESHNHKHSAIIFIFNTHKTYVTLTKPIEPWIDGRTLY